MAAVRDDGSFHFDYLPEGTYMATVKNTGNGVHGTAKPRVLGLNIPNVKLTQHFDAASQQVVLGEEDNDGVKIAVAPRAANATDEDEK